MTTPQSQPRGPSSSLPGHDRHTDLGGDHGGHGGHRGHGLMMLVCCIPMVAVVVLLVVSGTASAGALAWAVGCILMMAAMMFFMPGSHRHR